ncbi:hypothetical protein ACFE04_007152 [Oxalis oulophora]
MFPNAVATNLVSSISDHLPVMLNTEQLNGWWRSSKAFKFENFWADDDECLSIVKQSWGSKHSWESNLCALQCDLRGWSRQVFGNIPRSIKAKRNRLNNLLSLTDQRLVAQEASGHVFMNPVTMAIPKRVCELLHGSGRSWNMNLLRILFPAKIVDVIQAIPLGNGQSTDTFIWDGASNGVYTVKSGYEVAKEILCQMVDSDPGRIRPKYRLIGTNAFEL